MSNWTMYVTPNGRRTFSGAYLCSVDVTEPARTLRFYRSVGSGDLVLHVSSRGERNGEILAFPATHMLNSYVVDLPEDIKQAIFAAYVLAGNQLG